MSFRGAGVSILRRSGSEIDISARVLENPMCEGVGFNALREAHKNLYENTVKELRLLLKQSFDAVIIEMPCFTQSSKSALLIGMCWGVVCDIDAILVEPSALKKWSGSKRGDRKLKVKEKVLSRVTLELRQQSNDNIVDAVGLALMFSDLISQTKYDNTNR
jgi:Holliday junction resolvasome RuvABC endonuclease subunit